MNNNKKSQKLNIFFIIIFILYFIFFPEIKNLISPISDSFFAKINLQNSIFSNPNNFIKSFFTSNTSLLDKNKQLTLEIENKNLELINLKNKYLEIVNGNEIQNEIQIQNYINIKIINKDFFNIYDEVILDKGFIDGVNKGDKVYLYPDYYIGEIIRIEKNISILSLASKHKNQLEGIIKIDDDNNPETLSNKNISIDLIGMGGGDFQFEIPESINIATNTVVYLAYDESKEVGIIAKIEKIESSLYKKVFVRGYYNRSISENYFIKIRK